MIARSRHLAAAKMATAEFQDRVQPWMMACFGPEISSDVTERNHRFLEEALELVQSKGCTAAEAHQLVDYVFGREIGEPNQEAGGVMVTLAALCLAAGLDMHDAGETELTRIWGKVETIRAKQAAKPKHSPLPATRAAPARDAGMAAEVEALKVRYAARAENATLLAQRDVALADKAEVARQRDNYKAVAVERHAQRDAADRAAFERGIREAVAKLLDVINRKTCEGNSVVLMAAVYADFWEAVRPLLAPAAIDEGTQSDPDDDEGPDERDADYLRYGLREEDLP